MADLPAPSSASGVAKLPLQIRTLDGKTIRLQAYTNWTVLKLKEEFGKWKGQGFDKINLFYRAIKLDDKELISKYNIEPDGFVMANIRSTGGSHPLIFGHIGK